MFAQSGLLSVAGQYSNMCRALIQLVGGCTGADTFLLSWKADPCQPGVPRLISSLYLLDIFINIRIIKKN